jgi:glycosyltransferase involved in cell wall biosynthesis
MIREGLPVSLLLVGSCRPENQGYDTVLREQASALGVGDAVHFLGQRDDIAQILRSSDFMVLASTNEGLPLSILEAQACGAVVLAAPTAGVPEVVKDGDTGYLIAADNADGYAQRMIALMRDPGLRLGIAAQAQANILRSHTWSAYVAQIREIYATRPRPGFMLGRFSLAAGARAGYLR